MVPTLNYLQEKNQYENWDYWEMKYDNIDFERYYVV